MRENYLIAHHHGHSGAGSFGGLQFFQRCAFDESRIKLADLRRRGEYKERECRS
jgi:hypothetical protein